ncbi:MAG: acyltransferase, partial [Nitrosospira sp.]
MNQLRYRSDMEGLRAVAILAVVAAHAGVPWLAGGFVGVDVFFVLSGYLITGLLVEEHRAQGRIDLSAFYARRFRRLLPALLVMLVVTCGLGRLLLSPGDQPAHAVAAAAAAVWLSNFHFAFSNLDYFSPGADTNLFLHTWSLGVEEQFYLIWPALLILTMGRWQTKCNEVGRLRVVMLLVLLTSLLACVLLTPHSPLVAFYLMPARAWQFALGALAFLWFGGLAVEDRSVASADPLKALSSGLSTQPSLPSWAGWLGLALIAAAAAGFDKQMLYPGFWALVPSVGAALILVAGARRYSGGVGALLSLRPMQAIGRVSYALYLWHWPVLLLGVAVVGTPSWLQRFSWVVISLALAALSYRFVETPIRRRLWMKASPKVVLLGAVSLMICANA